MALRKKLIFIVENDHFHEELIHQNFDKDTHHEFVYFEHSQDCLDQLHRHPMAVFIDYDLRMLDSNEMDALSILDKIKRLEHHTEVVFFSGRESIELAQAALRHGAFDYLVINDYQYIRMKHVIRNIEKKIHDKQALKKAKRFKIIFYTVTIVYIIALVVLWRMGLLKSNSGTFMEPW
ncbi:MAG: response regulator [Cytophagaceae bacterium]|nr:response regulator [Cytophagaceae bacterium]